MRQRLTRITLSVAGRDQVTVTAVAAAWPKAKPGRNILTQFRRHKHSRSRNSVGLYKILPPFAAISIPLSRDKYTASHDAVLNTTLTARPTVKRHCLIVSTSAIDCLEDLSPKWPIIMSSGTLNPIHSSHPASEDFASTARSDAHSVCDCLSRPWLNRFKIVSRIVITSDVFEQE